MIFEKTILISALLITALIMLILSIIAWRRRSSGTAAIFLSICLLSVSIYCFGYAMELQSQTLQTAMFWVRFQHWGIDFIAPFWLLFALAVSGYEKWINKKLIIAIFIIPVVLFLASQTLGWLNLSHHNPRMDRSGLFPIFTYDRTIFNYIVVGYYSLCLAISMILFLIMYLKSVSSFKNQVIIYLLGSLPPWVALILYNLDLFTLNIDLTPLAVGLSGVLFTIGFTKYKILDIVPMARDIIFENIKEGVLILDMENRIIDFNPALKLIFHELKDQVVGKPFKDILSSYPLLSEFVDHATNDSIEFRMGKLSFTSYYRVRLSIIDNDKGKVIGKIISFYDFTNEKHLMDELERLAAIDGLTGVYNRQHFDKLVRKEISRVNRYGGELSMIMVDIDHFKSINDTFGHVAGDEALITVVETFGNILRDSDMLARFGGDEFVILALQTDLLAARTLAERLRAALEDKIIDVEGHEINVLASFGVTHINSGEDVTPEVLYRSVDRGVYQAKDLGGNAVCVSLPDYMN